MKNYNLIIFFFSFLSFLFSCEKESQETKQLKEYDGPLMETVDVVAMVSDSAVMKGKMEAPLMRELVNGDQEFPDGLYLEFYDENGKISATIQANKGYHFKEDDKWRGREDVIVKNFEKKQQLNTEELFWEPKEQIIYTDKFVIIKNEEDVTDGEGLEAKQDFSWWKIKKVNTVVSVDEGVENQ